MVGAGEAVSEAAGEGAAVEVGPGVGGTDVQAAASVAKARTASLAAV
jgi:hypothetical protein